MTMLAEPAFTPCATHRPSLREALAAQAPVNTGWVLLEHEGPWGSRSAADSELIPTGLRSAALGRGLRVQLIRRHRQRPGGLTGLILLANTEAGFVERIQLDAPGLLPNTALDQLAAGRLSGLGRPYSRPVYLVCTHGRFDARCAQLGRPAAATLAALAGERSWETTHVGGCRFAGNVVSLPSGVYYGHLSPRATETVLRATESGQIAPAWYRGRAGLPPAAQVAEAFLRRLTGIDAIADIRFTGLRDVSGWPGTPSPQEIHFTSPWGAHQVLVGPAPQPGLAIPQLQVMSVVDTPA